MQDQLKISDSERLYSQIVSKVNFSEIGALYIEYDSDRTRFAIGNKMFELKLREVKK